MKIINNRDDVLVCAHRGYMGKYPENSLQAIEEALKLGVDCVEIDLHYTKDRKIVLLHDSSIDRTTTGAGNISDLTYEETQQFNLLKPSGEVSDQKIPLFKDYLDLTKSYPEMEHIIEIKTQEKSVELFEEVYSMLEEYGLEESLLTTFDYQVTLAALEKGMPVQSFELDIMNNTNGYDVDEKEYLNSIDVIGLFMNSVTQDKVDKYKGYGLQMTIVPVDTIEGVEKALSLGLNLMACNYIEPALNYKEKLKGDK